MDEPGLGMIGIAEGAAFSNAERNGAALLRSALLDSRHRWRELVALATDLAFETDDAGTLVFLSPEEVLGWPASALLGHSARILLGTSANAFDPFAVGPAFRDRRAWVKCADGSAACLSFSAGPMMEDGRSLGMRGIARDMTLQDAQDA
jgi:PAS domain-containing protein